MSYLSQFNYQLLGPEESPKWVFLHGLMGYGANWRKVTSGLESKARILVYDQRGHGRSWQPLTGYSPEDYADDLFLILQELGWDQVILVGHSMGGRNALNFASRFPEKIQKLIIEDIGPEANLNPVNKYTQLIEMIPTPFASKLAAKEYFMNEFVTQAKGWNKAQMLGQYLYSNIIEKEDGRADWRFYKPGIILSVQQGHERDYWDQVKALSVPTLLVRGAESQDLRRETYHKMLESNPQIQGVEIPNAGHWVHSDQPELFLQSLKTFTNW